MFDQLKTKNKTKKKTGSFKKAFINFVAVDSVNKYDSNLKIEEGSIKNMIIKQEFLTKIKKLGFELSRKGSTFALVAFLVNGKPYVDYGEVYSYQKEFGVLREVNIWTDTYIHDDKNNVDMRKALRFYLDEGKVMRGSIFVVVKTGEIKQSDEEPIEYERLDTLPVTLMRNNALGMPDIPSHVMELVDQYDDWMAQLDAEWEKVKVIYANNTSFNSTMPAKELQKKIVDDKGSFIELSDIDGKLTNALAPITLGVQTMQELKTNIGFIESKILEYSHQFRDHAHGTTSSPNQTDIAMFNQRAFEYMQNKLSFRQDQLNDFMTILGKMTGNKTPSIELQVAEFEQWRVDILKSQRDLNVGQAEQALAIAKKNKSEAKALDSARKMKEERGNEPVVENQVNELPMNTSPISNKDRTTEPQKEVDQSVEVIDE